MENISEGSKSLLKEIGNTPLVKIKTGDYAANANIYAKYEALNPGGSIKSRTAYWMIKQAIKRGDIDEDTVLLEASSGNQGIGLSLIGAIMGLKVKIIMPESMSKERRLLIRAYGAEVILSPVYEDIGKTIESARTIARNMAKEDDNIYWVRQFTNHDNSDAHRLFTSQEIIAQVPEAIDVFITGIGTGGTITGIGEVLKEEYPDCKVVAVEPEKAAFLQGGFLGHHIQEGIGDGVVPEILNTDIIDDFVTVSDKQALETSQKLASNEGLFVGISSGSNIYAANQIAKKYSDIKSIVTVLPDSGDRYFSSDLLEKLS